MMVEMVSQKTHEQGGHAERVRQRGTVLQDNRPVMQAGKLADNRTTQLAPKPNNTGLPNQLKAGIESLSGMSMDHVKVHYNSAQPAQLNAHAYAQGSNIHLAPGQEKHLPHEAWHVVQQAQGRVKPTMQMKTGVPVNDDAGLEKEADVMGSRALKQGAAQLRTSETVGAPTPPSNEQINSPIPTVIQNKASSNQTGVVQLLVGAAPPIAGHDEVLPGVVNSRGAAAAKIAKYINLRARETAAAIPPLHGALAVPAVHENVSALGAHNAGNLYVRSNYTNGAGQASILEAWAEMTGLGGGYIKRVRITENAVVLMDRVMNDPAATALNTALQVNADAGPIAGAVGNRRYGSVHGVDPGDTNSLEIRNATDRDADNLTKVIGEGARFAWLADGLSNRGKGNTSTGVFNVSITIPQAGTFTMNPTFEQLWGSWASAFGRSYMKDKNAAKALLKARLSARLRSPIDTDVQGVAPLASGTAAGGQVTSLLGRGGGIMLIPTIAGGVGGGDIIADLDMTWTADH
ncbi:DUF4157 domain-containing protein [Rheinheimera sp. 1928-s]|uniref:eCIS core domain-containing protein n=1 Tax=Rheinheimera sp. 1928-s TaxID=3033803 RepID=UPI00261B78E5|nr:DUF4157 domain-containing protein [Rheinheimera sp. 1928-s]MDF3126601.1 DUF4157 domain-containing protein [Rheinheimera sp. 1928-s]